jgi:hypothetical protein
MKKERRPVTDNTFNLLNHHVHGSRKLVHLVFFHFFKDVGFPVSRLALVLTNKKLNKLKSTTLLRSLKEMKPQGRLPVLTRQETTGEH